MWSHPRSVLPIPSSTSNCTLQSVHVAHSVISFLRHELKNQNIGFPPFVTSVAYSLLFRAFPLFFSFLTHKFVKIMRDGWNTDVLLFPPSFSSFLSAVHLKEGHFLFFSLPLSLTHSLSANFSHFFFSPRNSKRAWARRLGCTRAQWAQLCRPSQTRGVTVFREAEEERSYSLCYYYSYRPVWKPTEDPSAYSHCYFRFTASKMNATILNIISKIGVGYEVVSWIVTAYQFKVSVQSYHLLRKFHELWD